MTYGKLPSLNTNNGVKRSQYESSHKNRSASPKIKINRIPHPLRTNSILLALRPMVFCPVKLGSNSTDAIQERDIAFGKWR
jgi:hypothetical protein